MISDLTTGRKKYLSTQISGHLIGDEAVMERIKLIIVILSTAALVCSCSVIKPGEEAIFINEIKYPDKLNVVKRTDWGWLPLPSKIKEHSINKITIHHGGVDFAEDKDPVVGIKNLQVWSRSEKNWIDIPYHFMIDLKGVIYEARPINYPGDTNTEYNPAGHALICVMGNYENQMLSEPQLEAIVKLSAFLAKFYGVGIDEIKTHKDYAANTLCPGKDIYKYFESGEIHKRIRDVLEGS